MGDAASAELQWWGGATEVRRREGNGIGQERWRKQGGGTELEDACVQQVISSGLKKKHRRGRRGKKWPLIKGPFPELLPQSVYQQLTS